MYWNVATHRRSPDEVLNAVEDAAARSAVSLLARLRRRAAAVGIEAGAEEIAVIRYEALAAEVTTARPDAANIAAALAAELAERGASLPEQCRAVTERMWGLSRRSGPAIVIGFASIPYLPAELRDDAAAQKLDAAVHAAAKDIPARFDTTISTIRYFPGISDVSFFGQTDDSQVETIAANTPAWSAVTGGAKRFGAAGIPCINVGPWGRDYHTRLERMHAGYGFRVVPALVEAIVERVLEAQENANT
jgi:arginine utilization protein RocB